MLRAGKLKSARPWVLQEPGLKTPMFRGPCGSFRRFGALGRAQLSPTLNLIRLCRAQNYDCAPVKAVTHRHLLIWQADNLKLITPQVIQDRSFPVGAIARNRKDALFAGHDTGRKRAVIASLTETCKLNVVTPKPSWPRPSAPS